MATQLRRYTVADEAGLERLCEWFPKIAEVRKGFGFTVDFAYADKENLQFVWATSHTGDFDASLATYNDSPERAAAFEGFDSPVTGMVVAMVDQVV